MSKVVVHRHPAKYLQRLPTETRERIKDLLKQLEQNPLDHPNIKHMVGEWAGYHRLRSGNLRIIFWFDKEEDKAFIICHLQEDYKKL